jgi:hypothetical protein
MRPNLSLAALLVPILVTASAVAAARATPVVYTAPPETAVLRPGPDLETANGYCGACHSVDYILTQPPTMGAGFWQAEVTKMVKAYGASIPDDDAKKIVDYLNATYRKPAA